MPPPLVRSVFTTHLPVRWGDLDALGHVNNAHYFRYFEEVRTQWLLGYRRVWTEKEGPVVAHAACTYRRPIVYPAMLRVELLCEAPRRASIVTRYRVATEEAPDRLAAEGEATVVWVDYATGRPISLPALFHDLWNGAA